MAMTIVWGNGMSAIYHTGYEMHIKEDGTVLCYAVDCDNKPYHEEFKMPNEKVEIYIGEPHYPESK